jgi:hypothetical protein
VHTQTEHDILCEHGQADGPGPACRTLCGAVGRMIACCSSRQYNRFVGLAAVHCRAMRRSESMHKRMKQLVVQAKMLTEHNSKRQELVGIRWEPDSTVEHPALTSCNCGSY